MNVERSFWLSLTSGLLLAALLLGCQPTVYLMPTPAVMSTGEHNPFSANQELEESTQVPVLYATNRVPVGNSGARTYAIRVDENLRIGVALIRIGEAETTWEKLYRISTGEEREERPRLMLEKLQEIGSFPLAGSIAVPLSGAAAELFSIVNDALTAGIDKDLMVYVHGANSSVYRAAAQAAQYRHFTGRNSVVLAFFWPSAENLLRYALDVEHASKSVPHFARLIELLARHTEARFLNILAYSAGGQVVSPALAALGRGAEQADRKALKDRLRLGEVYYAAPDVAVKDFVDDLPAYLDLPRSVTLALNAKDSVLRFAERYHKASRVGRPNPDELTPEEFEIVHSAAEAGNLHLIGIDPERIPEMEAGAHNFWYENAWVSSDVLVQFLFHADPALRGLEMNRTERGVVYWSFPDNYPDRIITLLREAKE
jgi:esterase/lipase superfamily enzyme